jgi:glycosyltransferase involved in cell wall biosynthesis
MTISEGRGIMREDDNPPGTAEHQGRWMREEYEPGLVSVIVPTYNRAHYLGDAMDSVFAQSYRPIELIVVDDGSRDDTAKVVERWRQEHAGDAGFRLRYFYQDNSGAPAARNLGLIESHGEFIQFLDSDDVLHPSKLRLQVDAFKHCGQFGYIWSDHNEVECEHAGLSPKCLPIEQSSTILACDALTVPPQAVIGVFARWACVHLGPWHTELRRYQDWEYTTRMLCMGVNAGYLPGTLYVVRKHYTGRIDDLDRNLAVALEVRLTTAKIGENTWRATNRSWDTGARIACHYFIAMVWASSIGDDKAYRYALAKTLELGTGYRVLMKKTLFFDVCRRLAGDRLGRWLYDVTRLVVRFARMTGVSKKSRMPRKGFDGAF